MTLPDGLTFLQFGWWVVHIASVALVYVYGYRKGRDDVRRALGERKDGSTQAQGANRNRLS